MAFRNEEEALRARVQALQVELDEVREELGKLARAQAQLARKQSPGTSDTATPADARLTPCEPCGGDRFTWGNLSAQGMRFVPSDAGFWKRTMTIATEIPARRCENCGCVVIFDGAD